MKWLRIPIILMLLAIVLCFASPVLAYPVVTITVRTGYGGGDPTGLTLTYIDDFQIDISWTKGTPAVPEPPGTVTTVVNTMIRVKWGSPPTDRTDGYEVYYGDASTFSDDDIDLTSMTQNPFYGAWSETVFYDAGGDIISRSWSITGVWKEANFMSISWLFMALALLPVALTYGMFSKKEMLLGFPSVMFWGIFSGYNYTLSTATWDIHYFVFFASAGMAIFSAVAMYALRKRDLDEPDADDGAFIDEQKEPDLRGEVERLVPESVWGDNGGSQTGRRAQGIRERAERRRLKGVRSKMDYRGLG